MTATADATGSTIVETLTQAVEELQETVEQQADRITELEKELADYRDHNERDKAEIRQRVTGIENQRTEPTPDDATPGDDADATGRQNDEAPLERICGLPEQVADRELTANQERARFIARDLHDYAEKAPAGLVIDSRAIKKVITAKEGTRPHTQTVARVMEFLDQLGKDEVELTKRRGRKLVAIDPDAADQYADAAAGTDHSRCDQGRGPTQPERVISNG